MYHSFKFLLYTFLVCFSISAQTNFVVNGDFSSDSSGWKLGVYGDAMATGSIVDSTYIIDVQNSGSETWNIQFTQSGISLDSGAVYSFSFEASAGSARTIEANVEKDGGDYSSYSGTGTMTITTSMQKFSQVFVMANKSDTTARISFNCGKYSGNVTLDNIVIEKITSPVIKLVSPFGGEQLEGGSVFDISWTSIGNTGKLKFEYSLDFGVTWQTVSEQIEDSGIYEWSVPASYSAWCMVRLSSVSNPSVADSNTVPFEIIPSTELIQNGYFTDSTDHWNLGVYGGRAGGTVSDGMYVLDIDTPGTETWQIQFSQTGIRLDSGKTYLFSFVSYASSQCSVNVNTGMSVSPYNSYMDSTKSNIQLTTSSEKHVIEFTMNNSSDTDARIEFNCGLAQGKIYIDRVSLVEKNASIIKARGYASVSAVKNRPVAITRINNRNSTSMSSAVFKGKAIIVDLRGRRIGRFSNVSSELSRTPVSPGVFVVLPGRD
jgi:hypothetical protein